MSSVYHNFSVQDIRDIRTQRNLKKLSLKYLAAKYQCSQGLISKIARGLVYKHVK